MSRASACPRRAQRPGQAQAWASAGPASATPSIKADPRSFIGVGCHEPIMFEPPCAWLKLTPRSLAPGDGAPGGRSWLARYSTSSTAARTGQWYPRPMAPKVMTPRERDPERRRRWCPPCAPTTARAPARSRSSASTRTPSAGCAGAAGNTYTPGVGLRQGRALRRAHPPPGAVDRARCGGSATRARAGAFGRSPGTRRSTRSPSAHAAAPRHGPEAVWPYYYAGTMGLVQRDGINRLRHAMRYSRQELARSAWR